MDPSHCAKMKTHFIIRPLQRWFDTSKKGAESIPYYY